MAETRQTADFTVEISPAAQRDLGVLPKHVAKKIADKISALQKNPRPPQAIKLTDEGGVHRIRHSDYRILYTIEDAARRIEITRVRHRKDVYKKKQ